MIYLTKCKTTNGEKFWKILMVSTTVTIFNAIIKKLMLFLLIYLHSDFVNALQLGFAAGPQ